MVDLYDLVCAQSFSQGLEVHLLEMVTCTPAMERSCKATVRYWTQKSQDSQQNMENHGG